MKVEYTIKVRHYGKKSKAVTIPKPVCEKLGIETGDVVAVQVTPMKPATK